MTIPMWMLVLIRDGGQSHIVDDVIVQVVWVEIVSNTDSGQSAHCLD